VPRLGLLFQEDRWGWLEAIHPEDYHEFTISETLSDPMDCQFSPDGALLISGNLTNVIASDSLTGREIGPIQGARITATSFDPVDHGFYLSGVPGLFRIDQLLNSQNGLALETRKNIRAGRGWRAFTFSQNGQWFAAANVHSNAAFVFDRTLTNTLATLGPHHETDSIAISPDGRWVTTGSFHDRSILVWNVAEEKVVQNILVGPMPRAVFSGDGKWLATFGDVLELRETVSWNYSPALPFPDGPPILGTAAFSPDGRLLAVVADHASIHLIDLHRFQSLCILRPPAMLNISGLCFSPDGAKLAAVGEESRAMIWDLQKLRRSLARYDLDWDLPLL
jgi:WD40 repeat protein